MKNYWKDEPFLRLLMPLMVGILLYHYTAASNYFYSVTIIAFALIGLLLFRFLKDYYKIKYAIVQGILVQSLLVSTGFLICFLHAVTNAPTWYKINAAQFDYLLVRINNDVQTKPKTYKANVDVLQLIAPQKSKQVVGEAIIYFQKSTKAAKLKEGDFVVVKNKLKDIVANGNPGEFDYAQYCHDKNLYQSAFINQSEWQLSEGYSSSIGTFFRQAGANSRNLLARHIPNKMSLGIAEALLMGYRNDIDQDIWQSYSNTGIVHIIAISGMHMAMIYMSVRWLLCLIPWMKKNRTTSLSIAIICMWLFAALTGLPPSVTRAAIMFTFLGMGEMLNREISGLNNLAASAFCLLCINPNWLLDVGFQLSYLAVLSLLFFYKKVYNWLFIPNKIVDSIWKLLAATIAAQILTFPLCIYYFHQFPILFLFTNLVAVPATTIILYTEIVYVLFSWIEPIAELLGTIILTAIEYLNEAVAIIGQLKFAVWGDLWMSTFELWIMYAIVLSFSIWLIHRSQRGAVIFLCLTTCLLISSTFSRIQHLQSAGFVIYNSSKQHLLEFVQGDRYFSPDEDSLTINKGVSKFVWQPAHLAMQVRVKDSTILAMRRKQGIELFCFADKRIARIQHHHFNNRQLMKLDYLILSDQSQPEANWLEANFKVKHIILDSSIPFWKAASIKATLACLQVPIHNVAEDGAFKVAL